jgi:hypothetical protein
LHSSYHANAGTGIAVVKSIASSDYAADMVFITRPHRAAAKERMRITSSGNIGIGTTDPQFKLSVNGTIATKEINVTQTGWSDFVFDESYELRSLKDLESYIKETKHLPDIPSEWEVRKEGLNMAQMMAKQMQKIEELTLYLIEVKKENDQLKERVALLERSIKANLK